MFLCEKHGQLTGNINFQDNLMHMLLKIHRYQPFISRGMYNTSLNCVIQVEVCCLVPEFGNVILDCFCALVERIIKTLEILAPALKARLQDSKVTLRHEPTPPWNRHKPQHLFFLT